MKIDCYLFEGCGSEEALRKNIVMRWQANRFRPRFGITRLMMKRPLPLDFPGLLRSFSMEKSCNLKGRQGSPEGRLSMSPGGSPTPLQLRQFGLLSERANIGNHMNM